MSESPIALTMGEPAGIGGEIALRAYHELKASGPAFLAIDNPSRLQDISAKFDLNVPIIAIDAAYEATAAFKDGFPVLPLKNSTASILGQPQTETAPAVIESITTATKMVSSGAAAAVVTNPIQKSVLYEVGFKSPGHTEFIAELCSTRVPVMMLASPLLRVVPVTVHMPLRKALDTLRTEKIIEHGLITLTSLRQDFGIREPHLAVAGLNPHAGENSSLGYEDDEIIKPAVEELQKTGAYVTGPVPPDALFTARARATFDAALCMYHDQALIPIKALDFDHAVNVTIGLPIVRTSPDHGTALDIANKGIADATSLVSAIHLASGIAANRDATR